MYTNNTMTDSLSTRNTHQTILLEMLLEVDKLCKQNDIKYFLDSGTLLGAIRHQGFIPWDDDVDISMLRPDYERFLLIAESQLSPAYFLRTNRSDPTYNLGIPKVILDKNGEMISLDIFVVDNAPNSRWGNSLRVLMMKVLQGFAKSGAEISYKDYNSLWERLAVLVTSSIGRLFPLSFVLKAQNRIAKAFGKKETRFKCVNTYAFKELHCLFPAEAFNKVEEMSFEGYLLPVPQGWHAVLSILYGNYMELPPEEERVRK